MRVECARNYFRKLENTSEHSEFIASLITHQSDIGLPITAQRTTPGVTIDHSDSHLSLSSTSINFVCENLPRSYSILSYPLNVSIQINADEPAPAAATNKLQHQRNGNNVQLEH